MLTLFILSLTRQLTSAILDCITKLPSDNANANVTIVVNQVVIPIICHENHRNIIMVMGLMIVNPYAEIKSLINVFFSSLCVFIVFICILFLSIYIPNINNTNELIILNSIS